MNRGSHALDASKAPAGGPAGVGVPAPGWGTSHRAAELAVLVVIVAWAGNFIVVKAANREIPPITFAFIRFTLASALLLVLLRWREGTIRVPLRDVAPMMGLGALGFGLYQVLWSTALQLIPAGDSAFLIATAPVFTALFASIAGSDTLTRRKLTGAVVSFAGVGIVVAFGPGLGLGASILGDLLTLGAAVCWAVYTSWGAPILASHSPLRTTTWAMVGGVIVLAPIGAWQATSADWASISAGAWAGFLYSAFLAAGVANVIVFHGVLLLGPTRITAFQFLVPFIAVVLGALFLAEAIQPAQLIGGAVIIAGVSITRAMSVGALVGRIRALVP